MNGSSGRDVSWKDLQGNDTDVEAKLYLKDENEGFWLHTN